MPITPEEEQRFMKGKKLEQVLAFEKVTSLNDLPRGFYWVIQPDGTVTRGVPGVDGSYTFEFGPLLPNPEP